MKNDYHGKNKPCKEIFALNFNFILLISLLIFSKSYTLSGQTSSDTITSRNIYYPSQQSFDEVQNEENMNDSVRINFERETFIQDSIEKRNQFLQDSLLARQIKLDSLNLLIGQLAMIIEGSIKTLGDDIYVSQEKLQILPNLVLSNYSSLILPFDLTLPFKPWKKEVLLSDKKIKVLLNPLDKTIKSIQCNLFQLSYYFESKKKCLIITEKPMILNKKTGKLYSTPVDSVWYDSQNHVKLVKRYSKFSQVNANNQPGAALFTSLIAVKEYKYSTNGDLSWLKITNYCDRWIVQEPVKVCNSITYTVEKQNTSYAVTRLHEPFNDYSDGEFVFEFNDAKVLKSVSFKNKKNTENWKTIIEQNEEGNTSRYVYQISDKVNKTLLINYFLNDAGAKNKVETITCIFEDDGISTYQKNNTNGKSRTRNKFTNEWSDWE